MVKKQSKQKQTKPQKKLVDVPIDIHCLYDELAEVNKIRPHPANPNKHPDNQIELLAKIMTEHGIRWPISISKQSNFVITGHGRLLAAKKLNLKKYPVVYQAFKNESEELAVLVSDNRIAELAETDRNNMGEVILYLDEQNYPLELTGLNAEEIRSFIDTPPFIPEQKETKPIKCPSCGYEW